MVSRLTPFAPCFSASSASGSQKAAAIEFLSRHIQMRFELTPRASPTPVSVFRGVSWKASSMSAADLMMARSTFCGTRGQHILWNAGRYAFHMSTRSERLVQARKRRFETAKDAALALGISVSTYSAHETGERNFKESSAKTYARRFGVPFEWLWLGKDADAPIPVVGYVGAGAEVFPIDDHAKGAGLDYLEPQRDPDEVAVRVRGDSMWPAFNDGDAIVFKDRRDDPSGLVGRECVVWCDDGSVYVKVLQPGAKRGRYTLVSYNAPPILDKAVVGAARVMRIERA